MKYPLSTLGAALALVFTFTACDKKEAGAPTAPAVPAVDPKVAFTNALDAIADDMIALDAKTRDNPEARKELSSILAKVQAVSTDGIPAAVATAFGKVQDNVKAMAEILPQIPTDIPQDPARLAEYAQANPEKMKALMEMVPKMEPLKTEGDAARKELEEAAKANGMDLTKFIKAGESK